MSRTKFEKTWPLPFSMLSRFLLNIAVSTISARLKSKSSDPSYFSITYSADTS